MPSDAFSTEIIFNHFHLEYMAYKLKIVSVNIALVSHMIFSYGISGALENGIENKANNLIHHIRFWYLLHWLRQACTSVQSHKQFYCFHTQKRNMDEC